MTTASSAAKGTPASARPMPASTDCTAAVPTTPRATPRIACAASLIARSPCWLASCRPKRCQPSAAASPFAYMTAAIASVQQQLDQQPDQAAEQSRDPRDRRHGVRRHQRREVAHGTVRDRLPHLDGPRSHDGNPVEPLWRWWHGEGPCLHVHATISSAFDTTVTVASESGRTSTSNHAESMAATARRLLPHSQVCNRCTIGHVAITMVAAQMIAPRNGRRIHNVDTMSATIRRTPRVARGRFATLRTRCSTGASAALRTKSW